MSRLYNIVLLGDGYKGKAGQTLFTQDVLAATDALFSTSPFNVLAPQIKLWSALSKQNLGCDDNVAFNEGYVCNPSKVMSAAASTVGPGKTVDKIIVLANGKGHGGSDSALIAVVGLGAHQASQFCTFNQAAFSGKMMHELGHCFLGPNHVEGTKMGSCTNGCCAIWNIPYSTTQQETITNTITAAIQ